MTQHKQSHRIKSHGRTSHHIALHQNRSHHHHGTAEGSFTAKTWFGHRAGRSPCTHSIGKFFLCYILLFSSETSAPGSPGNYLYKFLCVFLRLFLHWNEFSHFGSLFPSRQQNHSALRVFLRMPCEESCLNVQIMEWQEFCFTCLLSPHACECFFSQTASGTFFQSSNRRNFSSSAERGQTI